MGLFEKKQSLMLQGFKTRKDAFEAMLQYLINEKDIDPMDAAKQADEFASIFAKNMGLPEQIEPDRKGVDMWLHSIKKTTTWIKENPEIVEVGKPILLGAFSAIAGVFTGAKVTENKEVAEQSSSATSRETIDFSQINTIENYGTEKLETNNDNGGLSNSESPTNSTTNSERAI